MTWGDTSVGSGGQEFPQTTWGLVSRIHKEHEKRQEGLETLCRRYWKPIYTYVRRAWRKSNEDAKDLTQAFFLWLVDGKVLMKYQPDRSSFRHYMKGLLRNYVRNHEQALRRLKRGGAVKHLDIDDEFANLSEVIPDDRVESPEEAFDRAWVDQLIERATQNVRDACVKAGQEIRFQAFEAYELAPAGSQPTYDDVATQLGIKTSDVRNHLFAIREKLRTEIRNELRETVANPDQLEEEWKVLFC